jgi:2-polyprenyl-3-methyl-5-hydroxy-6-metoxy-1,4-benzoquinol methylase
VKPNKTNQPDYCEQLLRTDKLWKQILNVQYPYKHALKKMELGNTLDIGCGIGRVLAWLNENSIGVDHNPSSIDICVSRNLKAYTSKSFQEAIKSNAIEKNSFDNLLLAHVLEHLEPNEQIEIIESYIPFLRKNGGIFIITPQEFGYASDDTHVTFTDFARTREVLNKLNFEVKSQKSFPFPRAIGKIFKYNEFHTYASLKSL